jgi:serine protease Do
MLHVHRILFIGLLIAAFAFALTRYSAVPAHLQVLEKRLIPMHPKEKAPGTHEPPPQPAGPNSDAPLFTVDIERIPEGMTARGTSFPLGNGLWLTARHVVNEDCEKIVLIIDGSNILAEIKFLDPNADLAVLQAPAGSAPALPIETADVTEDQSAFAFGFPKGSLGATEGKLIGRARMKLGGRLDGTAPVLTWAEIQRFPDSLESLSGISGGPMLDEAGNVIGIIVAASVRRGRDYTVAPEILHAVQQELGLAGHQAGQMPARDVVTQPVSLDNSVTAMSKNARIALTYCIPPS